MSPVRAHAHRYASLRGRPMTTGVSSVVIWASRLLSTVPYTDVYGSLVTYVGVPCVRVCPRLASRVTRPRV